MLNQLLRLQETIYLQIGGRKLHSPPSSWQTSFAYCFIMMTSHRQVSLESESLAYGVYRNFAAIQWRVAATRRVVVRRRLAAWLTETEWCGVCRHVSTDDDDNAVPSPRCRSASEPASYHQTSTSRPRGEPTQTHNSFGDRAFAAAGPVLWNSLSSHPNEVDLPYNRFRRSLKTFFVG